MCIQERLVGSFYRVYFISVDWLYWLGRSLHKNLVQKDRPNYRRR